MALLAFNRKKQFISADVEGLIKHLTGFEEDSKNYQEVTKFAYLNIIHHNFATVDITAVKKSVEGIVEKFMIHGLNKRGKRLKELVDKYVASNSCQHSQLNVQWYVLLLLLKLSYNPTGVPEHALAMTKASSEPVVQEENIDWPLYLNEGFEQFQCPSDLNEDDELWQSSSDEGVEVLSDEIQERCNSVPLPAMSRPEKSQLLREAALSEAWLQHHILQSHEYHSVLEIREKNTTNKKMRDSSSPLQTEVVTEYQVVQEVLWMLQVPTDTKLFHLNSENLFSVKRNVSLPSTVPDSLKLFLEDLCPYFDMINNLKRFEDELRKQEKTGMPPPVTYQAYSAALSYQLSNVNKMVTAIQTKLNKQEETITLISIVEELTPGLHMLKFLYNVHSQAIINWHCQPAWLCATRLLSVLYETLLETSSHRFLAASLNLFIYSFRVYLDIIDIWLSDGRLEDWHKEFLVIRERGVLLVMPYEQEMRKCGVTPVPLLMKLVTMVRNVGNTMDIVSQLNKLPELRDIVHNKGCLFKEFTRNVCDEITRLKINHQKNAAISTLVKIKLNLDVDGNKRNEDGKSSNEETIKDLKRSTANNVDTIDLLCVDDGNVESLSGKKEDGKNQRLEVQNNLKQLSEQMMYNNCMRALVDTNPLLAKAFYTQPDSDLNVSALDFLEFGANLPGLMSVHYVMEKPLELVTSRHKIVCRLVTETLRQQYSLQHHFNVLSNVFFMESGNLAQRFYTYLFKEMEAGTWNNSLSLSVQLQGCIEEFYPGFGTNFLVLVEKNAKQTANVHEAISFISLNYRVDWPVSSIITQDTIVSYNKVFRFLLHLKYASWTLSNMHFSDLSASSSVLRARRLQVVKMWMYHSTNTLHFYFMSQVLHSFSTHLKQSILLADSIDDIIQAHITFLNEIKVRCLQDKKNPVETCIIKLLKLCSSLNLYWWKEATNSLNDSDIQALEDDYMSKYRALVHCLDFITSEGDSKSLLCGLRCEISYSVPDAYYTDKA